MCLVKINGLKAMSWLWAGSLLGAGLAFVTQIILARNLGPNDFGVLSSALALLTLLMPIISFGLPQLWLKVFGEEGWSAIRWIKTSLYLVLVNCCFIIVLLIAWGRIAFQGGSYSFLICILSLTLLGQACVDILSGKYQLEEKYTTLARVQVSPQILRFVLVCIVIFAFDNVNYMYSVAFAYSIAALIIVVVNVKSVIELHEGKIDLVGHDDKRITSCTTLNKAPTFYHVLAQAFPFGVANLFHLIYFQGAVLLLAYLKGASAAGIYNVAFVIMTAVYIFPNVLYQKYLMPKIHRWARYDTDLFYRVYWIGSLAMLVIGAIASACVWLLSPYFIMLLFGESYTESIDAVCLLSLCAPLRFMATSIGSVLVTKDHMMHKIKCMGAVVLFSIAMGFLLIPSMSVTGAVLATLSSEFLLLLLYYLSAKYYVFKKMVSV